MAVTYGFYNSLNKDRMYNAEQMSSIFNGIITDGVFSTIGDALMTVAGTGMQVIVKPGRAWFNSTWTLNDAQLPLDVPAADVSLTRIDAVILEVNSAVATRANSIKVLKGTPSANPAKPALSATETLHQYALAYITVGVGVTSITAANIEINVGKTTCPFITSVLQQTDITDLFNQWEAEFTTWFENVQAQLSGNVAANLQRQIDLLKVATGSKITDNTAATIGVAQDTTVDAAIDALGVTIDMMKLNKGYLTLTIKDTSGNPISGIPISIITDKNGNIQSSDSSGVVKGYVSEGTQSISISNYADILDYADNIDIVKGNFHTKNIVVTTRNFLKITSSKDLKISENVNSIDVTAVGGGGGGHNTDGGIFPGGGGGYCTVKENVNFVPNQVYKAIVGAGGHGSYTSNHNGYPTNGGASSFLGISAAGGHAGMTSNGIDGAGNGRGGYVGDSNGPYIEPVAGSVPGYSSFTETVLYGGGGAGGYRYTHKDDSDEYYNRTKTTYGGDTGFWNNNNGTYNGKAGFGGGGGGSYAGDGTSGAAGNGGSGCIAIRMHLKTAA